MGEMKSNVYTLEDYLEYKSKLERTITLKTTERLYNDSFVHAALVLKALIQKAINDSVGTLYMYCGEFSLFRDSKARELEDELQRIRPQENSPVFHKWDSFHPYQELIQTLLSFLEKGGRMGLVVEKDINEIKNEAVWREIGKFFINNQIELYKLPSPIGLNHFFVAGDSYRREREQDSKKAVCCFNNKDTSNILKYSHRLLRTISDPVCFTNN